jgi:hypothetical protein
VSCPWELLARKYYFALGIIADPLKDADPLWVARIALDNTNPDSLACCKDSERLIGDCDE